jgi:hypothetical protein
VVHNLHGNLKLHNLLELLMEIIPNEPILSVIAACTPGWSASTSRNFTRCVICADESKNYCWCYCGDSSINNEKNNPSVLCDGCNRYMHLSCTGLENPQEKVNYFCPGCKMNDRYSKYGQLPELIQIIRDLEISKLALSDFKFIDAFPYTYSRRLVENVRKQRGPALEYLAIKTINEMVGSNNGGENGGKVFFELVRFVLSDLSPRTNKELWESYLEFIKRTNLNTPSSMLLPRPQDALAPSDPHTLELEQLTNRVN